MENIIDTQIPYTVKIGDKFKDVEIIVREIDIVLKLDGILLGQAFKVFNRIDVIVAGELPEGALRQVKGFVNIDLAIEYCLKVKGIIDAY